MPRRLRESPSFSNRIGAELLRRADRELLAGELPDAPLELGRARAEALADLAQALHVELHPGALHLHEHVHERQLHLLEQPRQAVLLEPRALALGQHSGDHRALRDPVRAIHGRGDAGLGGQLVERVAAPRRVDQVRGDHRVVLEHGRGAGLLAHRRGLPVVVHERPLAARHGESGERLALRHEHLSPAVRGHAHRADRRAAHVERLLTLLLAGRARPLGRHRHQLALERPELGQRHLARTRGDDLLGALGRRGHLALAERLLQPLERRPQLELAEGLAQPRAVGLARGDVVEVDLAEVDVADRGGELLRDAGVLGVVREVLLALRAGDVVDVAEHALEVAVLLEQLRGGLLADPRDARDVVRGVALEADEVRDQLGRDAVAVDHRIAVVHLRLRDPAARGHHAHAGLDQLEEVAVAGHDHHVEALVTRPAGDGGDHVVGLESLHAHVLVAEAVHERLHVRPLLGEQVGLRVALALVLLVDLLATRHPGVPHHQRGLHAVLGDDLHEHRGEAEDRVRGLPLRGRDGLGQREKGAINKAVPVDQEQFFRRLRRHRSTLSTARPGGRCSGRG